MDKATRLQYLEAMGIDVWVSRHQPIAAFNAAAANNPASPSLESNTNQTNVGWAEQSDAQQADNDESMPPGWASFHKAHTTISHANDSSWTALQHEVAACRRCGLCETRTQTVFGVGNRHATWMLIGEAPGQNEDLQGEPFVGKAGQLLTEMLRAIGLRREEVYIANMLKCRPPHNRDPEAEEVDACHPYLQRQIALLQPKLILAVGRIAAQNLLKTKLPLAKLRGSRHQLDNTPLIVIHHPAYLLRSPLEKAKAWEDLQFALSVYKTLE